MENNWIEIKKKLWSLAIGIKGSTKEEFPADLCNLEDYIHSLLASQLKEVVGVIESVRPVDNGTVRYHESYNDGKRDLADEVKAEVEKLV